MKTATTMHHRPTRRPNSMNNAAPAAAAAAATASSGGIGLSVSDPANHSPSSSPSGSAVGSASLDNDEASSSSASPDFGGVSASVSAAAVSTNGSDHFHHLHHHHQQHRHHHRKNPKLRHDQHLPPLLFLKCFYHNRSHHQRSSTGFGTSSKGSGGGNRISSPPISISIKIVLLMLLALLVFERFFFNVKYVLMGRPGFLYGTPTNWDTVKGCLVENKKEKKKVTSALEATLRSDHEGPIDTPRSLPLNPNVYWEWKYYSRDDGQGRNNSNSNSNITIMTKASTSASRRRLLIAQYTGFGKYSRMLEEVAPVNKAYAKKWGHDYVSLQGTAIRFPDFVYDPNSSADNVHRDKQDIDIIDYGVDGYGQNKTTSGQGETNETVQRQQQGGTCQTNDYEAQSTFNKIPLLMRALEEKEGNDGRPLSYDQVLILDTDTMIVDLDFDITTLLVRDNGVLRRPSVFRGKEFSGASNNPPGMSDAEHDYMLAAYRVWWHDWTSTWDVNAGITLWNLRHPLTQHVADEWWKSSLDHPRDILLKNDDQFFLQRTLLDLGFWNRWDAIKTVRKEMEYYGGSLIKHFKRDARSWTTTSLDQRILRIREVKETVCRTWPIDCQRVFDDDAGEPVRYSERHPRQDE